MAFIRVSSPHLHRPLSTRKVMQTVILATLPGLATLTWLFGWGSIINVLVASASGLLFEAIILKMRRRNPLPALKDNSALLTCVLLGIALPPLAPWWLVVTGTFVAIVIAKQLYGGLGNNPFNPAMAAYALLLISFPVEMTQWVTPASLLDNGISLGQSITAVFGSAVNVPDAFTMATPLDGFKHKGMLMADEYWRQSNFLPEKIWQAWATASIAFMLGGLYLLWKRIFTWHIPVAMLGTLTVLSLLFYGADASNYASPYVHLLSGATLFGAFFIATDPVTAATSNKGKIWFGIGIGVLIYVIRTWGSYPDAVAFSVLLMNFAAPFIDYYTQPRSFGHNKARKGIKNEK
ncbi:electron transport complex subunit RsxD [Oceanospirillum linum]|uniref:Ion-translocating oxidoreductase complex subunit D n=1 Tax=Oceanospirillum linum TaxID=966 RepID=A0A1T1HE29_OCELI|nr:electron transport complex subunit RsxD [Oceanospirillum linum]OOV88121.1 electron transport complex subunit RsxD [Oceanospirillum linum]SEF43756.1 electron transport complex protein RnfD [Oleiphilus messinensis]SMP01448.1 electron transport complex protein RnfD [Oceanospirillum linum]